MKCYLSGIFECDVSWLLLTNGVPASSQACVKVCVRELRKRDPSFVEVLKKKTFSKFGRDHPDFRAVKPCPVPLVVVGNKYDIFKVRSHRILGVLAVPLFSLPQKTQMKNGNYGNPCREVGRGRGLNILIPTFALHHRGYASHPEPGEREKANARAGAQIHLARQRRIAAVLFLQR